MINVLDMDQELHRINESISYLPCKLVSLCIQYCTSFCGGMCRFAVEVSCDIGKSVDIFFDLPRRSSYMVDEGSRF